MPLSYSSSIKYPPLIKEGDAQLFEFASELKIRCGTENCRVLFIGRSNTLISAYLDAKGFVRSITLPISGVMRINPDQTTTAKERFHKFVLAPLLLPQVLNSKKFIVVDYINSGISLARASAWIQEFLKNKLRHSFSIEIIGYGNSFDKEAREILKRSGLKLATIGCNSSAIRIGDLYYLSKESLVEPYSLVESWDPLQGEEKISINPLNKTRYPYQDKTGYQYYASYAELIGWLKNKNLPNTLPEAISLNCTENLKFKF